MEDQLHPEIAFQVGIQQETKSFDIHPSLQMELDAAEVVEEHPQESNGNAGEEDTVISLQDNPRPQQQEVQPEPNRNWRDLRAQADEAKQAKREAEALARERDFYREQAMKQQKAHESVDDYRTDTEKQLSNQMEELRQQIARQQQDTQKAQQQAAIARAEQRLLQDYPDIRDVVNDDNIERLKNEHPNLYNSVIASNDVYSVGSTAYELIIAKGIYARKSNMNSTQNAQNSNINRNKPRSASTIAPQSGETPIQRAGSLMGNSMSSEDEKKALWAEMVGASKHRSF